MQVKSFTSTPITSLEQLQELMMQRLDLTESAQQQFFFNPPHPQNLAPEQTALDSDQLKLAKEIINQAIASDQKILIFGDYDCDGITSTALLWEVLYRLGAKATPFVPQRADGYGISVETLQKIWDKEQYDLVITVDNGIVAHPAIEWLKERQVKVIISDHHQPSDTTPPANAIVHSTNFAGVGVVWYLALALAPEFANDYLDLVALGTVADQIPVVGPNRSMVVHGLQALRQAERPSLQILAQISGSNLEQAVVSTIGFQLAPRINATGRLGDPMDALRALLDRNSTTLTKRWQAINDLNQQRQNATAEALEQSTAGIVTKPADNLVICRGEFEEGIIGLIAGKLAEQYQKPAIVLSSTDELYKASCRSPASVDITKLLRSLPTELFISLGGHAQAAGFSLPSLNWEDFVKLSVEAASKLDTDLFTPQIEVLGTLDWSLINLSTIQTLRKFAPFGNANEPPLFVIDNFVVDQIKPVGKTASHAQIFITNQETSDNKKAICFNYQNQNCQWENLNKLVVKLKASTYHRGQVDLQVVAGLTPNM